MIPRLRWISQLITSDRISEGKLVWEERILRKYCKLWNCAAHVISRVNVWKQNLIFVYLLIYLSDLFELVYPIELYKLEAEIAKYGDRVILDVMKW